MRYRRSVADERGIPVPVPWSLATERVGESLDVDPTAGLTRYEAALRLERYGRNEIAAAQRQSRLTIFIKQFKSVLVLLLVVAAALSAAFGQWAEALAVLMVPILNAFIGYFTELRATRSVEALRSLGTTVVTVRRGGALEILPSAELVPGDVVLVEGGDVVAADVRLLKASRLQVNESALTGESLPVDKDPAPLASDAPLHERRNMLYKGTAITRGSGDAVVVATGMATELGRISALTEGAESESTPLEKRLDGLGKALIWVTGFVAVLVTATGIGSGKSVVVLLQTAIALAVATVPEGLPIIATLTLARGVKRMADRNALVSRLSAVEALGATSVILTDKTGTLTENRMSVAALWLPTGYVAVGDDGGTDEELVAATNGMAGADSEAAAELMRRLTTVAVLCNDAELPPKDQRAGANRQTGQGIGDPMEVALLMHARERGMERGHLSAVHPRLAEVAFDSAAMMMATLNAAGEGVLVAVKGGPGPVLDHCRHQFDASGERVPLSERERDEWKDRNRRMASRDLRVLALAQRELPVGFGRRAASRLRDQPGDHGDGVDGFDPYEDLTFIGLVGFSDPPREDVAPAIAACRGAGIRVVMATGDQPTTARSIALRVGIVDADPVVLTGTAVEKLLANWPETPADWGLAAAPPALLDADVLARVSPEQKLRLIEAHQQNGEIVAMTGDGVNDAPALKRADIGVAMGLRGTEVAREAADMVLKDDAFATIVAAVREGRVIFDNIRAFVVFLMSCNLSEIIVIGLAAALGFPLPLLPLQILFINLVTDVFPALALGTLQGDDGVLRRPPRPAREAILSGRHWRTVTVYATLLAVSVLTAFAMALHTFGLSEAEAVTIAFLSLAAAQILHVFNMREPGSRFLKNPVNTDPWVWAAVVACLGLIALVIAVPPLASLLSVAALDATGWWLVAGATLAPFVLGSLGKALGLGRIS